jgi:hypothetical protein
MTCPQCNERMPAKTLWTTSGLSAVVCPNCHASLCPKAMCAVVLFAVSFGLGELVMIVLRREGAEFLTSLAALFVVFAAAYAVLGPMILRLRPKEHRDGRLSERGA